MKYLIYVFTISGLLLLNFCTKIISAGEDIASRRGAIRVGYFHGGRTALMMRAYENQEFEIPGLSVEFYSKKLHDKNYSLVPTDIRKFNADGSEGGAGKAKGTELIEQVVKGNFDLAMVGESSFVYTVYTGQPIVAIAELGHDVKGHSGHAFLMRKGLKADKPQDYLGRILVSRRAGPGDEIFLKEFLEKQGLDLKKDILQLKELPLNLEEKENLPKNKVIIIVDLFEDKMKQGIDNGVIDGGYFHLMSVEKLSNLFYIVEPLHNWANPELSQAVLVAHKDFLNKNRGRLIKLLEAYIKRIKYEHSLSYEERTRVLPKGLQMATNFYGLNYPQYDIIPTVDINLVSAIAGLMKKYNFIQNKKIRLEDFIDNNLILEAAKNLKITEKDDYWQSEY